MRVTAMHLIVAAASALPLIAQQQPSKTVDPTEGARVIRTAKGDGDQIYTCTKVDDKFKWTLTGPDARLLDDKERPIGTHFAGPTWKLNDGGQVQGVLMPDAPNGQAEAGAIPWLLLRAKEGTPTGSLASVAFIRRTDTHGGLAPPANGCKSVKDVDKKQPVHYTATYTFYAAK